MGDGVDVSSGKRSLKRYFFNEDDKRHYVAAERYYGFSDALVITEHNMSRRMDSVIWYPSPGHEVPEYYYSSDIKTLLKAIHVIERAGSIEINELRKLQEHWRSVLLLLYTKDKTIKKTLDNNTLLIIESEIYGKKVLGWEFTSIPTGNDASAPGSLIPFPWESIICTNWLLSLLFNICSVCKFL